MPRTGTFLRTSHPRLVRLARVCFAHGGFARGIPRAVRNGGALSHRDSSGGGCFPWRDPGSRGAVPSATLATFARSLPVPLAYRTPLRGDSRSSLHRPPASRGPFPQIPAFEGRCIRPGVVALPHRTTVGTPRYGALPDAAHRTSRCSASSGTDPWTPGLPPHRLGSPVRSAASAGGVRLFHFAVPLPAAFPHGKSVRGTGQP